MLEIDWKQFKSGTDIRGVAVEGVPGQEMNLTDSAVRRMTAGYLLWLSEKTGKPASELTVAVGHDSRISADRIQKLSSTRCSRPAYMCWCAALLRPRACS